MLRLEQFLDLDADVVGLSLRSFGELDADLGEAQAGDLFVEGLRQQEVANERDIQDGRSSLNILAGVASPKRLCVLASGPQFGLPAIEVCFECVDGADSVRGPAVSTVIARCIGLQDAPE